MNQKKLDESKELDEVFEFRTLTLGIIWYMAIHLNT